MRISAPATPGSYKRVKKDIADSGDVGDRGRTGALQLLTENTPRPASPHATGEGPAPMANRRPHSRVLRGHRRCFV